MFCTKCGKSIDDNVAFCPFCGAPVNNAANTSVNAAPQGAPMQTPAQISAPQYSAPQFVAPQFGVGGSGFNPASNVVDLINKILRGVIAIVGLLTLIGAIGTLGTTASILSSPISVFTKARTLYNFMVLLRVAAIITFILTLGGAVFTFLTKQRSLFSYISAGIGLLIFIFHFILFGASGVGAVIVFCIFLMLLAVALIGASVIIILNKEDIIPFKPNF